MCGMRSKEGEWINKRGRGMSVKRGKIGHIYIIFYLLNNNEIISNDI